MFSIRSTLVSRLSLRNYPATWLTLGCLIISGLLYPAALQAAPGDEGSACANLETLIDDLADQESNFCANLEALVDNFLADLGLGSDPDPNLNVRNLLPNNLDNQWRYELLTGVNEFINVDSNYLQPINIELRDGSSLTTDRLAFTVQLGQTLELQRYFYVTDTQIMLMGGFVPDQFLGNVEDLDIRLIDPLVIFDKAWSAGENQAFSGSGQVEVTSLAIEGTPFNASGTVDYQAFVEFLGEQTIIDATGQPRSALHLKYSIDISLQIPTQEDVLLSSEAQLWLEEETGLVASLDQGIALMRLSSNEVTLAPDNPAPETDDNSTRGGALNTWLLGTLLLLGLAHRWLARSPNSGQK